MPSLTRFMTLHVNAPQTILVFALISTLYRQDFCNYYNDKELYNNEQSSFTTELFYHLVDSLFAHLFKLKIKATPTGKEIKGWMEIFCKLFVSTSMLVSAHYKEQKPEMRANFILSRCLRVLLSSLVDNRMKKKSFQLS